ELLRRGATVRALTRDPAKASRLKAGGVEIVAADPKDPASLSKAFAGVEAAYVLIPALVEAHDLLREAKAIAVAIAEAIRLAGLRHVVALSSGGAHLTDGTGAIRTLHDFEEALRRTDASITYIRASDFMENWAYAIPLAQQDGVLPSGRAPLEGPIQTVSTSDIGRLAAECLLDLHDGERIINLLGPEDYSPRDIALALGNILDKHVEAVPIPHDELLPALAGMGFSADYARRVAELYDGLNSGLIAFEPGIGETRRGTTTVAEAFKMMGAGNG
ncbi:MAG: NAD(P)H-binding protein, partial [Rhizobiales bacterium]|nr:NAD(P)H-binding protein [Hyphomicrobiales bacterium]